MRSPWVEMWHGLGVGLSLEDYPWEEDGVTEPFEVDLSSDELWLALKRELGIRKLVIFLEHCSPTDERERVEISKRRLGTVQVNAYRDIARMRVSGDPAEVAKQEVHDALEAVRMALLS